MTGSVLEARLEDLLPAEALAELQAQVKLPRLRMRQFRPAEPVVVELGPCDPKVQALETLASVLSDLGVGDLAGPLTEVTLACATLNNRESDGPDHSAGQDGEQPGVLARAQQLLGVIESVNKVSHQLDAVLVRATRDLTAARGQLLLGEKGVASTDELSTAQRDKWRSAAKSAARHEIEAAIGWYGSEVIDLVGLATSPVSTLAPVLHSMATGESSWQMARRFFRNAGPLAHEDTAAIANGLFGDDPDVAVTERLDSSGDWLGGPWRVGEFNRALDREVARLNAADEEAKQAARERAAANRDLRVRMDAEGTAEITIGCTPLQAAAVIDRVSKAAKSARQAGAPELIRELRSKVSIALLLHGTLDTTTLPEDPDLITVDQSAELAKVLNGLPAAEIHVIVPFDTLIGYRANPPFDTRADHVDEATGEGGAQINGTVDPGDPDLPVNGTVDPGDPGLAFHLPPTPEPDPAPGVCEVVGRHSMFLMPEEAQLLALLPGSSLYRLLIDPASGRCVERSIDAYPFDARMRAQIIASDLFCRAPGCLRPARISQMDHVQEHGTPGGHTCEANAQPACDPHHDQKTKKAWDAVIEGNRDVTWTTLLGRIYRTKAHDFRQYTKLLTAATTAVEEALRDGADRGDVLDAAIYQALSYRDPGESLGSDDYEDLFNGWDAVTLTHIRDNGRRAYESDPDLRQVESDRHHATATSTDGAAPGHAATGDVQAADDRGPAADRGPGTSIPEPGADPASPWSRTDDEPPPF